MDRSMEDLDSRASQSNKQDSNNNYSMDVNKLLQSASPNENSSDARERLSLSQRRHVREAILSQSPKNAEASVAEKPVRLELQASPQIIRLASKKLVFFKLPESARRSAYASKRHIRLVRQAPVFATRQTRSFALLKLAGPPLTLNTKPTLF